MACCCVHPTTHTMQLSLLILQLMHLWASGCGSAVSSCRCAQEGVCRSIWVRLGIDSCMGDGAVWGSVGAEAREHHVQLMRAVLGAGGWGQPEGPPPQLARTPAGA